MEYEKCYVFEPEEDRPVKRRRTEPQGLQASWNLRKKACQQAWGAQQQRINERLDTINSSTLNEIADFLDESSVAESNTRVPTGLILAGPNSALRNSVASQLSGLSTNSATRRCFVSLSSGSGSNLKALLKVINQKATSATATEGDGDELEETTTSRKGPKRLNYDLQILYDYVQERKLQQVVIAFEDTEAFDRDLLSELIEILACWQDRIPFAFLLNVATSVEFLQQRLSSAAIRSLDGRLFDAAVSTDEVEQIFEVLTSPESELWLGPNLASMILERQSDYIQGIDSLLQATRYAYMSHYYANATSLLLDPKITLRDVPKDHFEALRNLPTLRDYARQLLDDGETEQVRELLDSDQALFDFAKKSVAAGRQSLAGTRAAAEAIRKVQACLPSTQVSSKPSLYIQAMSGKLTDSTLIRSLLLILRKSPSDVALKVIDQFHSITLSSSAETELHAIEKELKSLTKDHETSSKPLCSEDDIKNSTLRTTVVAQKVELSKQKSTLSKQDAAYTALVRRLSTLLETYFSHHLIGVKELPLNEIFVYDSRTPYREVFMPRPRHAVERALAAPHDYLDCECCDPGTNEEAALSGTQPATAILYQLYLESGSLINVHDLWKAFQAVIGDDEGGEGETSEEKTMALFQRSLADLRYLGFVKSTRKRVDHVAKVAWRGL
ncbi:hypothetical protein CBER1_11565 [Cercospora berteroae]|uniref:Uncharacterized protein n=1 Tax=Cercospora berteroae TaxID=357750 RepID=A0A2S6BZP3_9PEZI|nr:hypothetical protein CBER1_11565 [Cercospora berteroae]